MRTCLLVLVTALVAACKAEPFVSPPSPDLYKVPHDFGFDIALGPVKDDFAVADEPDLAVKVHDDLATDNPD